MFNFSVVMFQLNKDLLYQMVMSMGLTRDLAEIDSVTVTLFVLFCFTSDFYFLIVD